MALDLASDEDSSINENESIYMWRIWCVGVAKYAQPLQTLWGQKNEQKYMRL